MSPRWYDAASGAHLALDTGGGPLARFWATALAGRVDIGHVRATGTGVEIHLPKTALAPPLDLEWRIPRWSNTLERNRARSYFQAYARRRRCTSSSGRWWRCTRGARRRGASSACPTRRSAAGFTRRCAARCPITS